MKKLHYFISVLFLMAISVCIVSCGDDEPATGNNGTNGGNGNNDKPKTTYVGYYLYMTDDLISIVDVKTATTNPDGSTDTLTVEPSSWKSIASKPTHKQWNRIIEVKAPFSGKIKALISMKEGFEPNKDVYKIGINVAGAQQSSDGASGSVSVSMSSVDIPKETIKKYLEEKVLTKSYEHTVEVKE